MARTISDEWLASLPSQFHQERMDRNLLQATVTLAISDGQPIPRKTFIEFAKANLTDVAYPLSAIQIAEIFCGIVMEKYDDKTVLAYVGEYVTHAQDVIGHQFTVAELDMIGSLVSSVQASYRNFDIFTDEAMTARMMKQAEKIDEQLDDAMFYCAYKINSGLLRCCMEHFPEKKELAYTIVARMNKHQERYDGIEFVGKDRRHG